MRVLIDSARCQGHSRCWALAPDMFDVDDYGAATVLISGPLTPDYQAKARLAITNCPEHAISFAERLPGDPSGAR